MTDNVCLLESLFLHAVLEIQPLFLPFILFWVSLGILVFFNSAKYLALGEMLKVIVYPKNLNSVNMTFFLWNAKGDILNTVLIVIFHAITVNGDRSSSLKKRYIPSNMIGLFDRQTDRPNFKF